MRIPWSTNLLVACALACCGPGIAAEAEPSQDAKMTAAIEAFRKDKPYLAIAVGVVDARGSRWRAFGKVQRNGKLQPPDKDTLFEIGSITKTFTATLLAELAQEGLVRLDDPANQYLPANWQLPQEKDRSITLTELATHTSGLPVQPPWLVWHMLKTWTFDNPYSRYDAAALKSTLKNLHLSHPIGQEYEYSNLGFGLLGHALAGAAKAESYESLLKARILEPLGLSSTLITLGPNDVMRLAQPHDSSGNATSTWDFATLEACGGLRSTPRDMLRWLELQMGRKDTPLRPVLEATHQIRFPTDGSPGDHDVALGLGWHLIPLPERTERAVFHNGGTGGSRSFLAFVPSAKVGLVMLSNSEHSLDEMGVGLLGELLKHHESE